MKIKIIELKQLILQALRKKYDEEESRAMAEVVLFGELSGKTSHGLVRLLIGNASIMAQTPNAEPEILKKSNVSSLIIGHGNPGMLIGPLAMKEVIRIAKREGVGFVGTNDTYTSSGCLSFYLENIASANLIGIIMAQSPLSTVMAGGIEPLFGTNPIAFGIPSRPQPLIFDMATSSISFGAILRAKVLGQPIPAHTAIDKNGNLTTDPRKAMEGATLPFDNSYKGAGLAMMIEILSGLWPGADYTGMNPKGGWGDLFIAMSPSLLMNTEEFKNKVRQLIEKIKLSKTKNKSGVRIPGEHTIATRNKHLELGEVELDDMLYHELQKAAGG